MLGPLAAAPGTVLGPFGEGPAAAVSSWSPSDLGANLKWWLDSSDATSMRKSGGGQASFTEEIKQANDLSGDDHHGTTAGTGPTYEQDTGNANKPGMYFGGSNAAYLNSLADDGGVSVSARCCIVIIARCSSLPSTTGRQEMYCDQGDGIFGSGACLVYVHTDDTLRLYGGADISGPAQNTLPHVMIADINGASSRIIRDGSATSGAMGAGDFTSGVTIGNQNVAAGPAKSFVGYIYEVFILDRVPTSDEITSIGAYAHTKWGVA